MPLFESESSRRIRREMKVRQAMRQMQKGPLADYIPYTRQTAGVLKSLADLKPETLAVMHGSSYIGKGDHLLTDLAGVIKESFGGP